MHVSSRWAGPRLRAAVRLVLGAILGAVALIPDFLDLGADSAAPYRWATAILSAILLGEALVLVIAGRMRAEAWREALPTVILLGAVTITTFHLLGVWSGEVAVVGVIIFYAAELRIIVPSRPAVYAALVIMGVVGVASLAMADSEASAQNAQIRNAGDGMVWAVSQIFRAGVLVDVKPVTTTGQFLGFVVIVAGVFFAAVIFSAVTAWAVRERQTAQEDARIRDQVLAALREAGLAIPAPAPRVDVPGPRVLLDVDDVVGRAPRGWFTTRAVVIERFLDDVASSPSRTDRQIVAVLDADAVPADDVPEHPNIVWVVAVDGSAEWLEAHVRSDDIVVSGNRHVVDAARESRAHVVAPGEWRSAVTGASPTP
jgi:hypothetical protein